MGDPIQESPVFCPCSFSLSVCVTCLTSTLTQCPTGTTNPTHTQPQVTLEELQKEIANDGSRGTFGTPCGSKRTLSDYEKVQQLQRAGLTAPRWARQDADDVQRAKTTGGRNLPRPPLRGYLTTTSAPKSPQSSEPTSCNRVQDVREKANQPTSTTA